MKTMLSVQSTQIATSYTRESIEKLNFSKKIDFDLFSRYELPVHDVDDEKTARVVFYHR